jgi:hypothetical protein
MSFLKRNIIKLNKFIQGENDKNRVALIYLRHLGYPMVDIRKALIALNKINITELATRPDITVQAPLMHAVIYGRRENKQAREAIAGQLNLTVEEMFPPDEKRVQSEAHVRHHDQPTQIVSLTVRDESTG